MSLTLEQEVALFDILQVPYQTSVHKLTDDDNLLAVENIVSDNGMRAYTLIQSKITEIEGIAALEAILVAYLDDWVAMGTNVTTIDAGGIGDLNGLSDDPDRERTVIRGKVLGIVPFYRAHEEMKGTMGPRQISASLER